MVAKIKKALKELWLKYSPLFCSLGLHDWRLNVRKKGDITEVIMFPVCERCLVMKDCDPIVDIIAISFEGSVQGFDGEKDAVVGGGTDRPPYYHPSLWN